jgi:hypothetical protein
MTVRAPGLKQGDPGANRIDISLARVPDGILSHGTRLQEGGQDKNLTAETSKPIALQCIADVQAAGRPV